MKILIQAKISNGLGNQLFQYATVRALVHKYKIPFFLLNIESYRNDPYKRSFKLDKFNIKGTIIKNSFIIKLLNNGTFLNKILTFFHLYSFISENVPPDYLNFHYRLSLLTSVKGFWQNSLYFNHIRQLLIRELTPINIPELPPIFYNNICISVHVRRQDLLKEKDFGVLDLDYYNRAFDFFSKKFRYEHVKYIIFSDDIEWCKKSFTSLNTFFVEDEAWSEDYLQLYLMTKCNHNIVANSSFSWWGAWLNDHANKIVLRPFKPFINESLVHHYYPKEWISI
jgi:hypothetical protein